jgi:hypothetical protein
MRDGPLLPLDDRGVLFTGGRFKWAPPQMIVLFLHPQRSQLRPIS